MKLLLVAMLALLLSAGAALANVKCVQEFLLETAFNPGPADGAWGKRTGTALEEFFAQVGETVDGGLGKDNADAVCTLFSGPRHDELLEKGAFRIYAILLNPEDVGGGNSKTAFDFSPFEIADDANFDLCHFEIVRIESKNGVPQTLVAGEIGVENGTLTFGRHEWYVGGIADETYLSTEANLKLTREGRVVGMAPIFPLFIDAGRQAEPPVYSTFSTGFDAMGPFPGGATHFTIDDYWGGLLRVSCAGA